MMSGSRKVVALYIDPRGPYPGLLGPENCWDEKRDARLYEGPWPVIAHPPCGPWSKLRHMCSRQDASCGPRAVEQVRAFGGVLEHPAHSLLFDHMRLSPPAASDPDEHGGRTYYVHQVNWGHACSKPTWVYVVGVDHAVVMAGVRAALKRGGTPTHCVCTGPRQLQRLPVASKQKKRRSPPAFAEWLVSLARASSVRASEVA